jgi:hypothetical protein
MTFGLLATGTHYAIHIFSFGRFWFAIYKETSGKLYFSICFFIVWCYTDNKENQIFFIYQEIQSGAVAQSYMRKGFLIYEEMRKYFPIYEEAVSHI